MDKLAVRPTEAGEALGLSRTRIYQLVQSGEIPSFRIGRSVRIPTSALEHWLEKKTKEEDEARCRYSSADEDDTGDSLSEDALGDGP